MASVEYPDNDFTRMIARVSSDNKAGVRAGVASAAPAPTVQSAALGKEVVEDAPLTPERRAELDRLAREAGIVDERIGTVDPNPTAQYPTLEAAIAAGAPIVAPERVTAREYLAKQDIGRRLPDFTRVEGINLVRNVVVIDNLEFPIQPEDAADFRRYAIETARDAIMEKLEEAAGLFTLPETAEETHGGEALPEVSRDEAGRSVQPEGGQF